MFTFRGMNDDPERRKRKIRRILGSRQAMRIDELLMRLGFDKAIILTELEAMIAQGEVERLRFIDCLEEKHEFLRLNAPIQAARMGDGYAVNAENGGKSGERAMACLTEI